MSIVLITGGSRGLGKSMALHAAGRGFDVVLTYVSKKTEAEGVANEIAALGRKAAVLPLDVADSHSFPAFAAALKRTLNQTFSRGDFDALVNNAGIGLYKPFAETGEDEFDRVVAILLKAPFFLTQTLLPLIKDGGRIVNITSGLSRFAIPGYAAYGAAKAGLDQLSRYMAQELGPRRISVISLAPGVIATDFGGGVVRDNPAVNKALAATIALGRVGLPDDIGGALALLLETDARWINGMRIEASGGQSL
jgi:NAD(P)-dependent dehydrogenase (short-subunit alcohol dehydrogenase family)